MTRNTLFGSIFALSVAFGGGDARLNEISVDDSMAFASGAAYAPPYRPDLWNDYGAAAHENFCRNNRKSDFVRRIRETYCDIYNQSIENVHYVLSIYRKNYVLYSRYLSRAENAALVGRQLYANCYTYSVNGFGTLYLESSFWGHVPGGISSHSSRQFDSSSEPKDFVAEKATGDIPKDFNPGAREFLVRTINGLLRDGAEYAGRKPIARQGRYLVALLFRQDSASEAMDFHFVRENFAEGGAGAIWSHKMGILEVTDKDMRGQTITDPRTAYFGKYRFISFWLVPEGGLRPKARRGRVVSDVLSAH